MLENIVQSKYFNAVNSYTALDMSSKKIRGVLIEKKDNNIIINLGNNKAMHIELIENISIEKGDVALIERKNIVKSTIVDLERNEEIKSEEKDIYSAKLKELGIDVNEENIRILKKLDSYGIAITKENFETYRLARTSLDDISSSLDYDSAIKLVEMDIDLENESIEKIASLIGEIKEEKEGSNILKMFKKGKLTTEDAEEIAEKIYGSKMGKDIIDIIKSLHKEGVSITEKNIEKINDVFYKLHNLKDIEDKTFVDTIKNKLDINIDNLYKIKRYVKNEYVNKDIEIEAELDDVKRILNIKNYEITNINESKVTNKDLKLLEDDIKKLMVELDLEVSKDNISLSKEFIKRNMDITKENILSVNDMKEALATIIKSLDKDTAGQLIKENIDLEAEDIREVAEKVELIKNKEDSLDMTLETNIDIENTEEIMRKINSLKNIEEKDIITLLEKDIDFKINKIEQVIFGKKEVESINNINLDVINNISTDFKEIGRLDFNTIAFQIKRNIPMTIMNIRENQQELQQSKDYKEYGTEEIAQALNKNDLEASRLNIKKTMEAFRSYNNIKENLTSNMIKQSVSNNIEIRNIEINLVSNYVKEYGRSKGYTFVDNANEIVKNSDENIMFLMKNRRSFSFKELKQINSMFENKDQIGHKISDISDFIDENGDNETKDKFEKFKQDIMEISKSMKGSKDEVEEAYKRMEKSIKDMEENMKFLNKDNNNLMKEKTKQISENIDENKMLAKENKIIQLPLYMNGQFTNLNMYFRDRQKEGSKKDNEDISVILSINTVNMGNINVNLDIKKKNVDIKISLKNIDDKFHIENHKNTLIDFLEQDGYIIDEISFHDGDKIDIVNIEEESKTKPSLFNGNLDVII